MNGSIMHVKVSGGRKGLAAIATFMRLFLGFGATEQVSRCLLGGGEWVKFLRSVEMIAGSGIKIVFLRRGGRRTASAF